MNKLVKQQLIENMRSVFLSYDVVLVAHNNGLSVSAVKEIRRSIKGIAGRYFVVKNTLVRRAIIGTKYEGMANFFAGPTAVACANDPIGVAKAMVSFCNNNKLRLLIGAIGDKSITIEQINYLATLPSLSVLQGRLIGILNAPAQKALSLLQSPGAQIARLLRLYSEKH